MSSVMSDERLAELIRSTASEMNTLLKEARLRKIDVNTKVISFTNTQFFVSPSFAIDTITKTRKVEL